VNRASTLLLSVSMDAARRVEAGAVSPRTPLPLVLDRVAYRLENENRTTRALISAERRAER
jgi:hypothetical protein